MIAKTIPYTVCVIAFFIAYAIYRVQGGRKQSAPNDNHNSDGALPSRRCEIMCDRFGKKWSLAIHSMLMRTHSFFSFGHIRNQMRFR